MSEKPPPPTTVKFPPETVAKINQASKLTGLPKQEIIRLATAIGLEDLRKVGFNLARVVSDAAEKQSEPSTHLHVADEPSGNESSPSTRAAGAGGSTRYPMGNRKK